MSNLQLKTGVNSLSWMNEDNGSDMNMELGVPVAGVRLEKNKLVIVRVPNISEVSPGQFFPQESGEIWREGWGRQHMGRLN